MSKQKSLQRLLRIRELEEERKRLGLAAAMSRLDRLASARDAAVHRARDGRSRVARSAISGEVVDRQAGLIEAEAARRRARMLEMQIVQSRQEAAACRQDLLAKRMERRQTETVLQHEEVREKSESDRKSQKSVDDWYGVKTHRQAADDRGGE